MTATALITRKNDFVLAGPVGSFDAYMDKVSRIPVLSREDEAALAVRFRNEGDLEAARQLVVSHLRFVVHIARGYSGYGLPLGDAFQLRDDVLGAFGETTLTGKPVGDDLREGKPTPLMAMATARADRRQAEVLGLVGRPDLTAADVERVQEVLVGTGALAELESVIDDLAQQALVALDVADITDDARKALAEMAHYVAWREL